MRRCSSLAALLLLAGCTSDVGLLVDLRTDWVPGVEFTTTDVRVTDTEGTTTQDMRGVLTDAGGGGTRIAEFFGLAGGEANLRVALVDASGNVLAERPVSVVLSGTTLLTAVLTRDCRGVVCPDAALSACVGGRCAAAECTPETPEACTAECDADAACPSSAACALPRCLDGVCLNLGDDAACGASEYCDPESGCRPDPRLPMADAGVEPGGVECGVASAEACGSNTTSLSRASTLLVGADTVQNADQWSSTCGADGAGDDSSTFLVMDSADYEFTFVGTGSAAISVRSDDCEGAELACGVGRVTATLNAGQRAVVVMESATPSVCISGSLRVQAL